jgi:hypothetical protein
MREDCYVCGAPATSEEHAPPESFFPEGYRSGLVTVPSCADHNTKLSTDVEYVRNALCGQRGTNLVAAKFLKLREVLTSAAQNCSTGLFPTYVLSSWMDKKQELSA